MKFNKLAILVVCILAGCSTVSDTYYCDADSDCVFTNIGEHPCGSCDSSDEDYQCVSPNVAERLIETRMEVLCSPCFVSPEYYRCICSEGICTKTSECVTDQDCYSRSFRDMYKCMNSTCKVPPAN